MWKKLRYSVVLATLALGGCLGADGQGGGYVDLSSYERGKLHFNSGQYGLAVKHFRSAVDRRPDFIEALNGLAASYDRLGRYDLSARYYGRALAGDPDSAQTLNNIGYSYLLQKRFDLAVAYLRDAQSRDAHDPVVMANREVAEVSFQKADLKRSAAEARAKSTASAPAPAAVQGTASARTDLAAAPPARPAASSRRRIKPWIERTAPSVQTLVTQPQVALLGAVEATGLNPQLAAYRPSQPKPEDLLPEPLSAPLGFGGQESRQNSRAASPSAAPRQPARVGPKADLPPRADVPLGPDQPRTAPVVGLAPTEVTVASLNPLDRAGLAVAGPEASTTAVVADIWQGGVDLSNLRPHEGLIPVVASNSTAPESVETVDLDPVEVSVASLTPFHDMADVGPRLGARFDARDSVTAIDPGTPGASVVDFDPLDLLDDMTDGAIPAGRAEAVAPAPAPEIVVANLGQMVVPSAPAAVVEPTVSVSVPLPLVELSNGTGRRNMAARLRDYFEAKGVRIGRLTNADHYRHAETTIYFRKGWRAYAEDLARMLPAVIDLDGVAGQNSDVRLELGGDLLDFDRGMYYAGQRSHGANPG